MKVIAIALAGLLLTGCGAATATSPSKPTASATIDPVKKAEDDFQKAIDDAEKQIRKESVNGCKKLVKSNLKAPATARFSGQKVKETGEYRYVITGYVDSENGFGALMRLDYRCTVKNGTVHLDRLHQWE
jgi:hypothetical protein